MSVPLTTPIPNPAIPQAPDPNRPWDADSTGNTLLDLIQRLQQHVAAAQSSTDAAIARPSLQNDAGALKDLVLGTVLGLPIEALDTGSKMLTGAALSTLGNLAPTVDTGNPLLSSLRPDSAIHNAANAPMRQDPFQDLLARNQAGAAGHGFAVGLLNSLLNPSNLLGPGGVGSHAFQGAESALPTIAQHAETMAAAAGKAGQGAQFMEAAAAHLAQGQPLNDVLASAMQATGKPLGDLTLAEKIAAIPSDSPFKQQLLDKFLSEVSTAPGSTRGNVAGANLIPGIGADGGRGLGPAVPPVFGPDVPPAFGPAFPEKGNVPADQLIPGIGRGGRPGIGPTEVGWEPTQPLGPAFPEKGNVPVDQRIPGIGIGGRPGIGPVLPDAGAQADAVQGALPNAGKAGDLVAPADKAISPETSALIDKVAPDNPAAPMSTLDRMDALSGPPLRQLLNDLLTITYDRGAKKALNSITGAGATFGPDSRLMQNGQDVTRSLLDYLLQRDSLSPKERDALQASLFPESRVGRAAAQQAGKDAVAGMSPADAMAQIDQPDGNSLAAMRDFILNGRGDNGMPALPGNADFYSKRVPGITDEQVPSLLKQLQQEGTLGYDARHGYIVKPGAAGDLGGDSRAAWQQNYVNQSQAGTDVLAQGGKVAGSDVTQGSMNAMSPQDRMAMLQKLAGGDTPAASAPVGAVPAVPAAQTPALETVAQVAAKAPEVAPQAVPPEQIIQHIANETVPPPEQVASIVADPTPPADLLSRHVETQHSTDIFSDAADVPPKGGPPRNIMGLLPQVTQAGTTASGGLIGGIAGYQAGNGDGRDPLAGITGGVVGAAVGAGLGNRAFTPGGVKTIQFFGALGQEMVNAEKNALQNGSKTFTLKTVGDQWAQQQIQSPKNVIEELASNTLFMLRTGVGYGKVAANMADLRDLFTAGARDASTMVTSISKDMHTSLGFPDALPNLGGGSGAQIGFHSETVAHPMQSAINQAVLSAASPTSIATSAVTGGVPVGGLLYGAARGAVQPMVTAAYEAFDGIVKAAFRSAVYEDALAKQVASDAATFLDKVQQLTGSVPATLPQSGMFSADTIKAALSSAPSGVADSLAAEWATTAQQAMDTAAAFSRQTFGDFSNVRGFEKFIRSLVPFSSFIIRAIPRTLELVQDHPAIAAAYITQMIADGQRATAEGRPSSQVGGVPIDSKTPLLGKLADMETGGRGGTAHVNFLSGILPIPTGVFGGMGLDTSGQDAPVYDPSGKMIDQNSNQKQAQLFYMQFADAVAHAGFSVNPIVQMVAYAANWDFKRPGALSKDAEFQQTLPGPRVGSLYAGLDFVRKNIGGGTVNDTTAADKVLGQLFYDKYGMSMADPRAAKLAAQTMQPDNPLVQQAQDIANKAALSKGTLGELVPSSILGQTQHELDVQKAQGEQSRTNAALIAQSQADPQGFQDFMQQLQERQLIMQNIQKYTPLQYQQMLYQGQTPIKGANPIYGQLIAPQNNSPLLITQGTDSRHRAEQASLAWQQENRNLAYFAPAVYQAQLAALHNALGLPSQP